MQGPYRIPFDTQRPGAASALSASVERRIALPGTSRSRSRSRSQSRTRTLSAAGAAAVGTGRRAPAGQAPAPRAAERRHVKSPVSAVPPRIDSVVSDSVRKRLDATYGLHSSAAATAGSMAVAGTGGRRRGRQQGPSGRASGRGGSVASTSSTALRGPAGVDAAADEAQGGVRRKAAEIMDRLNRRAGAGNGARAGPGPGPGAGLGGTAGGASSPATSSSMPTTAGTYARSRAVVQRHGYLYNQDIDQLSQTTGYTRRELYRVFGLYKALSSLSTHDNTIDIDTLRRGIPMLAVEDDLFVGRIFALLDGNTNALVRRERRLRFVCARCGVAHTACVRVPLSVCLVMFLSLCVCLCVTFCVSG